VAFFFGMLERLVLPPEGLERPYAWIGDGKVEK
jgi:hypothetical protein